MLGKCFEKLKTIRLIYLNLLDPIPWLSSRLMVVTSPAPVRPLKSLAWSSPACRWVAWVALITTLPSPGQSSFVLLLTTNRLLAADIVLKIFWAELPLRVLVQLESGFNSRTVKTFWQESVLSALDNSLNDRLQMASHRSNVLWSHLNRGRDWDMGEGEMLQWTLSHTLNNPQTKTGESRRQEMTGRRPGDGDDVYEELGLCWGLGDTGHSAESPYAMWGGRQSGTL